MPCTFLYINIFRPKTLFRLVPSSSLSTYTSAFRHAQFSESPFLIHKLLSILQDFSQSLIRVKSIHAQIITHSLSADQFVATRIVKAYSDLGSLNDARHVFDEIPYPEVFLCNAMMNGYLRNEQYGETLKLFRMMSCWGLEIDSCTCTFALKACTGLSDYESGMGIIRRAVESGMMRDRFFGSSMITFLLKFDHVDEAKWVFDGIQNRDVVCWNSMIGGYVQACRFNKAIDLFLEMCGCGIRSTPITMVSLIQACGGIGSFQLGKCIHGCVLGLGMGRDVLVLTSLVDMYSKMGQTQCAYCVFERMPVKSLVSWNAMISGCVQNGLVHESFDLFHKLVNTGDGFDSATIVSLLQGCSQTADLVSGNILHGCILRRGLELNLILSTTLVDLYSKCGAIDLATYVFNCMKNKNVITWTAMLVGLAQNGQAEDALKLFHKMQEEEVTANFVTLVSLVHCCAHLGSLKQGRSVHARLIRCGVAFDTVNMTSLIDMYAKCGKMNYAERVFENEYVYKDVILWNSIIMGYGIHGHGNQAISVYRRMVDEKVEPNQATFISLLAACSHAGLVEEGISLFNSMETDHNIRPNEKHYACFVDLLGRAGRLEEAEAVIRKMPFEPGSSVFEALLSWCCTHKNVNMGVETADKLLQFDAMNPGIYVVLSNIYAEARRWDAVDYIRDLMRKQGLKKIPGYSLTEVGNQVHSFCAGDDSHPKWSEIYQFLEKLRLEVETCGYVPNTSCVLRDVDEKMKVKLLWGHSERLAIAFGLLNTPAGSVIRITKNLRVCVDCHSWTKYVSKIVNREIIVRDANRFHHFLDGKCSCVDYW
ncbi:pentatricopeptide repeat-containing protein At3g12770-like [Actinidia eriantha]|uniref:pentatricopeptide repeat-containing protein At3g12770-like n=1 Tax=Actinidia eriantha TaxID=165200 RepID=UPI00258CFEEB|nr:pentatricopeptide repeat-containing protein At3g12770-like [Actinidia eriantha]XP_057502945.1 pentatricopeptide repeat-containing protein At3g12770-like [Actinidia eriantha]XP_057502946.1 pentatricopeptide repeat-containing protein At3g12770-like [Actinidia eriantha]XP_057502947.1 pentatricopeptide repeat-containing protein At3g12770-like [Actinidia eriantha]